MARVEDSLKRLQTDYIDLYQSHVDDKATPFEETLAAYETLIKQGKVRAIGASNYDAPRLAEALKASAAKKLPRYETLAAALQPVRPRRLRERAAAAVREGGRGGHPVLSRWPSGSSPASTGPRPISASSARGSRVEKYLNERGLRILKALDDVSARLNAKPAQVALAWLSARPCIAAPIASATNLEQLEDLVASTRLKLDADAIKALDAASA